MYYTLGFVYGDGQFKDNRAEVVICVEAKKRCIVGLKNIGFGSYENSKGFTKIFFNEHEMFVNRDSFVFPADVLIDHNLKHKAQFIAGLFDASGVVDNGAILLLYKKFHFLSDVRTVLSHLHIDSSIDAGVLSTPHTSLFSTIIPTLRLCR